MSVPLYPSAAARCKGSSRGAWLPRITPAEQQLVALLALAPDDDAGVLELASTGGQLAPLLEAASRHGLFGVVHAALRQAGVPFDADFASATREQTGALSLQHDRLGHFLSVALRALERAQIEHACLKGPVLAERLYRLPELRPSLDIDLLVADRDCDRAIEALCEAGWDLERAASARYHRAHHHHVRLMRSRAPMIELHVRALVGFGTRLPSEPLLARSLPYASRYGPTRVLRPEDEMAYLALHAAGHACERLMWLYDLKLLAARHPTLDWRECVRVARDIRALRPLRLVLRLLARLGGDVPKEALGRLTWRDVVAERARREASQHVELGPARTATSLAFNLLAADGVDLAVAFAVHNLAHIARRRLYAAWPNVVPEDWSA